MRIDKETKTCRDHGVEWCIVCYCDDMHDWYYERAEKRRAYKQAWRDTPIHEKFDLGGEA